MRMSRRKLFGISALGLTGFISNWIGFRRESVKIKSLPIHPGKQVLGSSIKIISNDKQLLFLEIQKAYKNNESVAYFSMKDKEDELAREFLNFHMKMHGIEFENGFGKLPKSLYKDLAGVIADIASRDMYVLGRAGVSIKEILRKYNDELVEKNVKLVVFDSYPVCGLNESGLTEFSSLNNCKVILHFT